jgi:hypothetical protein
VSLVLVGGGNPLDDILVKKVIELAGGPDASLVVIPTARGAASYEETLPTLGMFRQAGAKNVRLLHTYDRAVANSDLSTTTSDRFHQTEVFTSSDLATAATSGLVRPQDRRLGFNSQSTASRRSLHDGSSHTIACVIDDIALTTPAFVGTGTRRAGGTAPPATQHSRHLHPRPHAIVRGRCRTP